MERASRVIGKLKLAGETIGEEELACAAWPAAVGKTIALRTRPARMVRKRLIVEVEDGTWQRNLFGFTGQILANLAKSLGGGMVEELEFRVVPRRREPQRAQNAETGAPVSADEADAIADPVLRRIYKTSRSRARA